MFRHRPAAGREITMSETTKRVATAFVDEMGSGNIDAQILAPDFAVWTANSGEISGATYLTRLKMLGDAFKVPLRVKVMALTADGDRVAAEAESYGVLRNDVEYRNRYHFAFVFSGDKIKRFHEYIDTKLVVDVVRPVMEPGRK